MVPNFCFLKAVFSNESLLVPHQREVRVKRWKQPYGKECTGRGWKRDNSGIVARNISLITLSCNLRTLFTIILLDTMPTYRNDKIRNNYDYLYWVSFMQLHVILNNILHLEIIFIFRIGISWNYLSPPQIWVSAHLLANADLWNRYTFRTWTMMAHYKIRSWELSFYNVLNAGYWTWYF